MSAFTYQQPELELLTGSWWLLAGLERWLLELVFGLRAGGNRAASFGRVEECGA